MAVNDIYQNTLVGSLGTVALANVFYTKLTVDAGPAEEQDDLVAAFVSNVVAALKTVQSSDLIYECILSRKVDPTTGPAKVYPISDIGAVLSPPMPSNSAITVTTYSLPWDNTAQGRYFLAGIPETWIQDGRLKKSNAPNFDAFLSTVTDDYEEAGSTYQTTHLRKKFNDFVNIINATIQPIPSRQRNRTQRLCSIS